MGIKPTGSTDLTPPASTPQERFGGLTDNIEADGSKAGEVLTEIYTDVSSANTAASEMAADLTALESQPLLLWWDGTGTRPVLKPGWALLNTSTGIIEKD